MNPYFTEQLAKEHYDDLLRAADTSRPAHSAEIKARHGVRWSNFSFDTGPVDTARRTETARVRGRYES